MVTCPYVPGQPDALQNKVLRVAAEHDPFQGSSETLQSVRSLMKQGAVRVAALKVAHCQCNMPNTSLQSANQDLGCKAPEQNGHKSTKSFIQASRGPRRGGARRGGGGVPGQGP